VPKTESREATVPFPASKWAIVAASRKERLATAFFVSRRNLRAQRRSFPRVTGVAENGKFIDFLGLNGSMKGYKNIG
jgi:hypothetical protein